MNENTNYLQYGFSAIARRLFVDELLSLGYCPISHSTAVNCAMPEDKDIPLEHAQSVLYLFESYGLALVPKNPTQHRLKRLGRNLTNASGRELVKLRKRLLLMARFLWLELINDPYTYGYRSDDDCLPDEMDIAEELSAFHNKFVDNGGALYTIT